MQTVINAHFRPLTLQPPAELAKYAMLDLFQNPPKAR
jgi:hypothetical protein